MINPLDPLGSKNSFKFAGEALGSQTGLYYLRARYYDPSTGRFLSKDPLPASSSMSPLANPYSYALSNPLALIDPTGLSAEPVSTRGIAVNLPQPLQSWASVFLPFGVLHGLSQVHVMSPPLAANAAALRSAPGVYIGPAVSGGNNSASGYSPYNTFRSTQTFISAQIGPPGWTIDDWNYIQEQLACVPAAGDICIPSGGESPHTHEEQATLEDILNGIGETNSRTPVPDFAQPEFMF